MQSTARAPALPKPVAVVVVASLLACAGAAWLLMLDQPGWAGMGGLGVIDAGIFLVTWVVMMVAMMFPAAAPMVLAHASVVRSRGGGSVPTAAFVGGYLAVWTSVGLVPLAVIQALNEMSSSVTPWLGRLGGVVILVAGLYQLTPLKNACLRACRSPLGFVLTHDFGGGPVAALRAGTAHGMYCLGCCWALMAVLAVLGLMNVAWMAVFAVLFFLEKNWRHGVSLSRVVGAACAVGGLAVIVSPGVLGLAGGPMA